MLAKAFAPALFGIDGRLVSIECDITSGLPGFIVVGLGDKAVEEARERVRSAIKNSGLMIPPRRLTLNLAPADLPKDGSGYDLGMAMAILAASGQIDPGLLKGSLFIGELSLDGQIRPVKGAVMAAQLCAQEALEHLFVPQANATEAAALKDCKVFAVSSLLEVYRHLVGDQPLSAVTPASLTVSDQPQILQIDFNMIYGQSQAKRAMEIAAAGGHNILLSGPPGTGKTLLAKAAMGILPPPNLDEMLEITKLHSLTGQAYRGLISRRPFRSPHHTASSVALIGGGANPRPGEISLSHGGVLFLDELPEFPRGVLEVLRQPLEDGSITIARAAGVVTYPARFMLIGTRNPCPCGYAGDPSGRCNCPAASISHYRRKISGPLLDRIDLFVEVSRLDNKAVITGAASEASSTVAQRVAKCRETQMKRLSGSESLCNAHMSNREIKVHCKIDNETRKLAEFSMKSLGLSARGFTRILKVARTIADLDGRRNISTTDFNEALQYRPRQASDPAPARFSNFDE
jgi:magnesium chelatase family protein